MLAKKLSDKLIYRCALAAVYFCVGRRIVRFVVDHDNAVETSEFVDKLSEIGPILLAKDNETLAFYFDSWI